MNTKDPKQIVIAFNECINRQDIDGLSHLMSDDHTFIDREGHISKPKEVMIQSWIKFFQMCPGYKNTFNSFKTKDNLVIITGYAYWNEDNTYDPAIWVAKIENDLVAEWRIYYDTKENRELFGIG